MHLTIEQALGTQNLMFYHAAWPVSLLTPVCTLATAMIEVNCAVHDNSKNLSSWSAGQQDQIARLLWVNWIHQRLEVELIRKPVLTHLQHGDHVVDCGDTRLMALNLLQHPGTVSVICVVSADQANQFTDWIPVCTNQDLINVTGFGPAAAVQVRSGHDQAIEWLEIGDHTTAHHLHSIDQRLAMMQNYLNQHPDLVFDTQWAKSLINWSHYAN